MYGVPRIKQKTLKDILLWAANTTNVIPELLFLAGDNEPLITSITSILEDMSEQVVTPLLSFEQQKSLGIPFANDQTVIAQDLRQLISMANDIHGRPVILHINRDDLNKLAEGLLYIQDDLGSITIRLKDIDLLNDDDIQDYQQQLSKIADIGLMREAGGTEAQVLQKFPCIYDMNLYNYSGTPREFNC